MSIYHKDKYLNKDIQSIISASIKEWDIKSAGFSILKSRKMLTQSQIEKLESMEKFKRNVAIGMMMKDNKELVKVVNEGLIETRKKFFEMNGIEDFNILTIRRDAIFTINKPIKYKRIDGHIQFVNKNSYSSYYYLNGYEFYRGSGELHMSGLGEESQLKHKKYMLHFLDELSRQAEIVKNKDICDFIYKFSDDYRKCNLKRGYYREFNDKSLYFIKDGKIGNAKVGIETSKGVPKEYLDNSYNYMNYILPLIQMFY